MEVYIRQPSELTTEAIAAAFFRPLWLLLCSMYVLMQFFCLPQEALLVYVGTFLCVLVL